MDTMDVVSASRPEATADLSATIDRLVDQWCERRSLSALRQILSAWPSPLALTDDWGQLREALRTLLAVARSELTPEDVDDVEEAIVAIDVAMNRAPR